MLVQWNACPTFLNTNLFLSDLGLNLESFWEAVGVFFETFGDVAFGVISAGSFSQLSGQVGGRGGGIGEGKGGEPSHRSIVYVL